MHILYLFPYHRFWMRIFLLICNFLALFFTSIEVGCKAEGEDEASVEVGGEVEIGAKSGAGAEAEGEVGNKVACNEK